MRILRVITSVDPKGGGPIEGVKQMSQALVEGGHVTDIACLDDPQSEWLNDFPFKTYALGPGFMKYRYSKRFVPWLKENVKRYDYVIVHGIWQFSSFGVWLALYHSDIPYFVYPDGMLDPWFNQQFPLKRLKKMLYWPWAEYRVLRDARAVFFTSEEEQILARRSFAPYQCNERIVPLGTCWPTGDVEKQKQSFFGRFPHLTGKRLVLFLGRIHPKKGCDLLIDAFSKMAHKDDSLQLVIAGPDQIGWQVTLQKKAEELNISHWITWTGMVSGDLKWGAYHSAEVFILPSHQENFGIAVVEALSCGLPVLISNKVNIWREIVGSKAGLAAGDDLKGTIELLEKWLALPDEQKKIMKQNARHCFLEKFEIHKAAESLLKVLRENGVYDKR